MGVEVRRLREEDVKALNRSLSLWSSVEYDRRLQAQRRFQLVQVVAWDRGLPVGRGMVLFPDHEEFSTSAAREGCAEVRDVFVPSGHRRRGVATALMKALEEAVRQHGKRKIGLSVALDDNAAPARALFDRLGYRHAHGPYVTSGVLQGDEGPFPVGAVLTYLVRDL
ncbi:MAG: GNAT family N-acetyltransferase [Actinomycetota bacterium]